MQANEEKLIEEEVEGKMEDLQKIDAAKEHKLTKRHTPPPRTSFYMRHYRLEVPDVYNFIMKPLPKDLGTLQCVIMNHEHIGHISNTISWEFRITDPRIRYSGKAEFSNSHIEDEVKVPPRRRRSSLSDLHQNRLVFCARSKLKSNKATYYIALADCMQKHPKVDIKGKNIVGTVTSEDFKGTSFTGFTAGLPATKTKVPQDIRKESIHIMYEHLPGTSIRRTRCTIPEVTEAGSLEIRDEGLKSSRLEAMMGKTENHLAEHLVNRSPVVDPTTRRSSLVIGDKLVEDWDYNLQLDLDGQPESDPPVATICRREIATDMHQFDLTVRRPLSVFQAFQLALATIENAHLDC